MKKTAIRKIINPNRLNKVSKEGRDFYFMFMFPFISELRKTDQNKGFVQLCEQFFNTEYRDIFSATANKDIILKRARQITTGHKFTIKGDYLIKKGSRMLICVDTKANTVQIELENEDNFLLKNYEFLYIKGDLYDIGVTRFRDSLSARRSEQMCRKRRMLSKWSRIKPEN